MVNAPDTSLKVIIGIHLVLSTWGGIFLPTSYLYMHGFILAFGFWCLVNSESTDAMLMFLGTNLSSIFMDVIFLCAFTNTTGITTFSQAMAIINLICKPFTGFVLYRLYQDRGGRYADFGIPGMPSFGNTETRNNYENIDQSTPGASAVETAAPHHTIEKPLP